MLLVESSAWVLLLHGRISLPVPLSEVAICPPIALEVLRGSHDEAMYDRLRAMLMKTRMLDAPMPAERFEAAARLYMRCRDTGVTVRSSIDCLIAACAIAHDVAVMHHDRDFELMKRAVPLQTLAITRS